MKHALALSALAAGLLVVPVQAQVMRLDPAGTPRLLPVEAYVANPEKLRLLVGLAEIQADLQLGLLFLEENMARPEGSHFTHARETVLPDITDGLAGAGVPDLAPLLQALEAATGKTSVQAAYHEVEAALLRARATLAPSSEDTLALLATMARKAEAMIDPSGISPAGDYQSAWAILMVARGELDLLARNQDPAVARLAGDQAMAFDDVILVMPDPHQLAPVAFDPALIGDLVRKLEAGVKAT